MMVAVFLGGVRGGGSSLWPAGFLFVALGLRCPVQLVEFSYLHPIPPHPHHPGIEPVSLALEDRFLTTGLLGKSLIC